MSTPPPEVSKSAKLASMSRIVAGFSSSSTERCTSACPDRFSSSAVDLNGCHRFVGAPAAPNRSFSPSEATAKTLGVKNHGYSVTYTSLISRAASAHLDLAVGDFTSTTTSGRPLTQYTRSNRREVLPGTVMVTSSDTTSVLAVGCSRSMTFRACHTPSASRNSLCPRSRRNTCSLARTSPPSTEFTVATISSTTASTSNPPITSGLSRTRASRRWPASTVCVVSRGSALPAVKPQPIGRDHRTIRFWNSRSRMPLATTQTPSSAD